MEFYKRWVRKNKDYVHQLESLASGLTWLLPERFSDSEIGPEAVTTILGILTAINEHIIDSAPTQIHAGPAERPSFPWPLWISMLKDLESLVEVVAQQYYGDDKKWHFLAITEATKVLVRLSMFRDSGYKMLLQGGETPNVESGPKSLNSYNLKNGANPGLGYIQQHHGHDTRNLEGRALTALNRFGQNARMGSSSTWLGRHQQELAMTAPPIERPSLSTIFSEKGFHGRLFVAAEVLFTIRPLVYVLFIRKYGVRSWMPWLVSLVVDLTGMGFLSYVTRRNDKHFPLSSSEQNEIKRRKLLWALYIMRDPFFSTYTRQRLEKSEKFLEPVPVIGFFTAKLIELIVGAQSRYTYMSGS